MATLKVGGQWTVSGTAATVTAALGLNEGVRLRTLSVKNAAGAANNLYIGRANVAATPTNAHVELAAGESYDFFSQSGHLISTDEVYMVGTAAASNIAFITGMS